MAIQLNSMRFILKRSLQTYFTRGCSSQVRVIDEKHCNVRVRVALSSADPLNSSYLRLALYNYLFASANKGQLIIRIEDFNQVDSNSANRQSIFDGLEWAGIIAAESPRHGGDFGPYEANQRLEIYQQYAQQLVDSRKAYYCFCSQDRLADVENAAKRAKKSQKYDSKCRYVSRERVEEKLANKEPRQIRLKVESDSFGKIEDMARGEMTIGGCRGGDPLLINFDGVPTTFFRGVVDDQLMQITHVFRSVEHLPDTPLDLALYDAFGWSPPQFAHVPLNLKLGKWQKFAVVEHFRKRNYFPLAVLNYLISCEVGFTWSASNSSAAIADMRRLDCGLHSIAEMKQAFDVKKLSKTISVLNPDVFNKCNRFELLRHLDDQQLHAGVVQQLQELVQLDYSKHVGEVDTDPKHVENVLHMCRHDGEITSLDQLTKAEFAFLWILPKVQGDQFEWITPLTETLQNTPDFDKNSLVSQLRQFSNSQHLKYSNFVALLKKLLDHNNKGPGAVDMMAILGREKTIERLLKHVHLVGSSSEMTA